MIPGAVCAGTRTHLSQVLVVVGVGIAAELGAVDDVAEQAHALGQLNLGRLVGQQGDVAAGVGLLQRGDEAGVRLGQLVVVMALYAKAEEI